MQGPRHAAVATARSFSLSQARPTRERWPRRAVTVLLHLMQPVARLIGRTRHGLTLWRRHATTGLALPRPWTANIWTKVSRSTEDRLQYIEKRLHKGGWAAVRSGETDRWDLEVKSGILGSARLFLGLEQHGSGRQLLRIHSWPRFSTTATLVALSLAGLACAAARDGAATVAVALGGTALLLVSRMIHECAAATAAFLSVVRRIESREKLRVK